MNAPQHKLVGYASDQPRTMCFVPGKLELVIACQSLVLALDLSGSDEERADPPRRLFRGHAAAVSTISFSSCGRGEAPLGRLACSSRRGAAGACKGRMRCEYLPSQ